MSSIKVRLKPTQGIKVNSSTVYVFDESAIAEQLDLAKDWAIKTDGQVNSEDYSAKAYAIGGTGTETNNSKYWAGKSKEYAESIDLSVYRTAADQDLIDSGKQDTISDLDTIRSGASAGATAVQPGDLATVATSGNYSDLIGTPTIPTDTSDLTNNAGFITGIDSTDVTTALGYTPADDSLLAAVATSGAYSDLSGTPTIPTVNDSTITITQGGVTKGSFTLNQASGDTIALDAGGYGMPDYSSGISTTISTSNTYTAPSKGIIVACNNNTQTRDSIIINGVDVQGNTKLYMDGQYLVDTGDVIQTSATAFTIKFFPLKGV